MEHAAVAAAILAVAILFAVRRGRYRLAWRLRRWGRRQRYRWARRGGLFLR